MNCIQKILMVSATFIISIFPALTANASDQLPLSLAKNTASIARNTLILAQDTAITAYIYAKLATYPEFNDNSIDISTHDGRVTLNGIVNSNVQAKKIFYLAANTTGVKSVDLSKVIIAQQSNDLYLKPVITPSAQPRFQKAASFTADDPILTSPKAIAAARRTRKSAFKKNIVASSIPFTSNKPKARQQAQHKAHHKVYSKKAPASRKHKITKPHHPQKHSEKHALKKQKPHLQKQHQTKSLSKKHRPPKQKKYSKKTLAPSTAIQKKNPALKLAHKNTNKQRSKLSQKDVAKAKAQEMTRDFLKTALMANKTVPDD